MGLSKKYLTTKATKDVTKGTKGNILIFKFFVNLCVELCVTLWLKSFFLDSPKGGGCQNIGKGFFFAYMVNHFGKVLSYK